MLLYAMPLYSMLLYAMLALFEQLEQESFCHSIALSHHTLLHHITYLIDAISYQRDRRSSRADSRPSSTKERMAETENVQLPPPPLNSPCGHSEFPSPSSLLYRR